MGQREVSGSRAPVERKKRDGAAKESGNEDEGTWSGAPDATTPREETKRGTKEGTWSGAPAANAESERGEGRQKEPPKEPPAKAPGKKRGPPMKEPKKEPPAKAGSSTPKKAPPNQQSPGEPPRRHTPKHPDPTRKT